jgi:hypothetical protein
MLEALMSHMMCEAVKIFYPCIYFLGRDQTIGVTSKGRGIYSAGGGSSAVNHSVI